MQHDTKPTRRDSKSLAETRQIDIGRVHQLAELLDRSIKIPGVSFRIGWDGILGLIPVLGDAITVGPLFYYLQIARRYRLPRKLMYRMCLNQGIDFLVGSIPLLGDFFDFAFKANLKNARLLEKALREQIVR